MSETQRILVESARAYCADHEAQWLDPAKALNRAGDEAIQTEWSQIVNLGWTGMLVSEQYGGSELGVTEAVLLCEELAYGGCPLPFVSSAMVPAGVLGLLGDDNAGAVEALRRLVEAGSRTVVAIAEASGEWSLHGVAARAAVGDSVSFEKRFVEHPGADGCVLVALRDAQGALGLLKVSLADLGVHPMSTLSDASLLAVSAEDLDCSESQWLGVGSTVDNALRYGLAVGALGNAAQMVGSAQRALDISAEHAKTREQSGQPIGAFQAIAHQLADMLRDIEGSRWMVRRAAWQMDNPDTVDGLGADLAMTVAMAKSYANDACTA
ncbi:MAG: acyl-CoA/acyl-ACP dehydrogenase, partial [Chromatiales bacterium]|nr:acyl-CoA/acyl-ACP dehydrogenase [Chromatiales bacterium]